MTIGSSGKTAPVHRARCSRTQQLSGPLTEMNRCVTSQLVAPVGTELTVAEVGDEEPLHAANVNAVARARSAFKTSLSLDQDSRRLPPRAVSGFAHGPTPSRTARKWPSLCTPGADDGERRRVAEVVERSAGRIVVRRRPVKSVRFYPFVRSCTAVATQHCIEA